MGKPTEAVAQVPTPAVKAVAIERRGGKWVILELTIASGRVTETRTVGGEYYRDLAEDAAIRWVRRAGR